MFKTVLIAVTGTLLAGSAPALAATDAQPAATTAPQAPAPQAASPTQRYCVIIPHETGSMIDRRVCQTRDKWLAEGFDPLAKK